MQFPFCQAKTLLAKRNNNSAKDLHLLFLHAELRNEKAEVEIFKAELQFPALL